VLIVLDVLDALNAAKSLNANALDEPVPAHGRRALHCPRTTSGPIHGAWISKRVCRFGPLTRAGNRESVNPGRAVGLG